MCNIYPLLWKHDLELIFVNIYLFKRLCNCERFAKSRVANTEPWKHRPFVLGDESSYFGKIAMRGWIHFTDYQYNSEKQAQFQRRSARFKDPRDVPKMAGNLELPVGIQNG